MTHPHSRDRTPLTRERVIQAAISIADRDGLDALTMRQLGAELGVEAMSVYRHVTDKDDILDGMVEVVMGAISLPDPEQPWSEALRVRCRSARQVLARHSWAIGLIESRGTTGPIVRNHLDAVLGVLRGSGFSVVDAAHAFWILDSYVYGHVIQETSMSRRSGGTDDRNAEESHPHLEEMRSQAQAGIFTLDGEFEFGLDVLLDALAELAAE